MRVIIPARGGSERLIGKNLMEIGGKPLVVYAADQVMANLPDADVWICTENDEIAGVARAHGYKVLDRPAEYGRANVQLDEFSGWLRGQLVGEEFVLYQPTVVASEMSWLEPFVDEGRRFNKVTTVALDNRHRAWMATVYPVGVDDEIGVRYYPPELGGAPTDCTRPSRTTQFVDIDTFADLQAARSLVNSSKRISFQYREGGEYGWGHKRRVEAIAKEFQDWQVNLFARGWETPPDVFVVDHLDTTEHEILKMKQTGAKVVTLEDTGPGAQFADLTINALLKPDPDKRHHLYGPDYFILRPEFLGLPEYVVKEDAHKILVTFGGQDPANLSFRVEQALDGTNWDWYVVRPPLRSKGVQEFSMAERMLDADLVITSCGRTLLEAAAVGVPALSMAANLRESTHGHIGAPYGNHYLGMGDSLRPQYIHEVVEWFMHSPEHRKALSDYGKRTVDGKGLRRIVRMIRELV